jgi:hypothetical protein
MTSILFTYWVFWITTKIHGNTLIWYFYKNLFNFHARFRSQQCVSEMGTPAQIVGRVSFFMISLIPDVRSGSRKKKRSLQKEETTRKFYSCRHTAQSVGNIIVRMVGFYYLVSGKML